MSRYKVLLGVPSNGLISEGSARASWLASLHHEIFRQPSANASGPNFNPLWCDALNCAQDGKITHFAMLHADLTVREEEEGKRWLDLLLEEMDAHDLDFLSCPNAIKDHRGLTSSGIGNPDSRWNPWRRFTVRELESLPTTFTAADYGYPHKFLLHNHALCVWDMRKPLWFETDAEGRQRVLFNFEEQIRRENGRWVRDQESDDWYFSRKLWEVGASTAITTRVPIVHHGGMSYPNAGDWGLYQNGDEDTAAQWRPAVPLSSEAR